MTDNRFLGLDMDLAELATMCNNFSGAELVGLVRAASSHALMHFVKLDTRLTVDP